MKVLLATFPKMRTFQF